MTQDKLIGALNLAIDALKDAAARLDTHNDLYLNAIQSCYGALEASEPTPSQSVDEGLLEEWLIKNMPPATVIGDPKWWAKRIRNVLSYENANLSKPQQKI